MAAEHVKWPTPSFFKPKEKHFKKIYVHHLTPEQKFLSLSPGPNQWLQGAQLSRDYLVPRVSAGTQLYLLPPSVLRRVIISQ